MGGKDRMFREKMLYEASLTGNVESLKQLMQEDKLILARVCVNCFDDTPLHIAAMLGHLGFARELVSHKPDLAGELNSQGFSPLHLASANGYVEIVKLLISVNSDVGLIRDKDGRTPLHLAVMKGRDEIIQELVRARSEVVRYRIGTHETLLHLAVKHNRVTALKLLLELHKDDDFVNSKDDYGNTILHTATSLKQIETMKYLLSRKEVKVNEVNENGLTAYDIIENMPRDLKSMEIKEYLVKAGALRARNFPEPPLVTEANEIETSMVPEKSKTPASCKKDASTSKKKHKKISKDWLDKKRDSLMVAASVIAAMAYQAAISPPGGISDQNSGSNEQGSTFTAGTSILAETNTTAYMVFIICNTIAFVSSLSLIFLLVSGLPLRSKFLLNALMGISWLTISSTAFAYLISLRATCNLNSSGFVTVLVISYLVWLGLILIVLLIHIVRFIIRIIKRIKKCCTRNFHRRIAEKGQGQGQACV